MATAATQPTVLRRARPGQRCAGAPERSRDQSLPRLGRIAGHLLLEVFLAMLPTDVSAFVGVVVRSRRAYLLAAAQVLAGALLLARALPTALNVYLLKVS